MLRNGQQQCYTSTMDRPFLQTPQWAQFQEHIGRKVWRVGDGFATATIIRNDVRLGQNFLSIPYGPELDLDKAQDGLRNDISHFANTLRSIARAESSMFVRIEPTHDMVAELLLRNGMRIRKTKRHLQPRYTVVADLTLTEEQLMEKMHHKHRYNISLAQRKEVTVELSNNVDAFWHMLQKTAEHDDFRSHPMLYYQKLLHFFSDSSGPIRTKLYFAYHGGAPIAGAIILEYAHTAYYLHGASYREHRALMGPHLLHWQLMQRYKANEYHWYDFWGVDSDQYPGVTRFKLGFGARLVEYAGAFDLVLKPFWRWLYNWAPR